MIIIKTVNNLNDTSEFQRNNCDGITKHQSFATHVDTYTDIDTYTYIYIYTYTYTYTYKYRKIIFRIISKLTYLYIANLVTIGGVSDPLESRPFPQVLLQKIWLF